MKYIAKELSKETYDMLWKQGAQAIIDYGWGVVMNGGFSEEEDYYKGAYIHENKTTNKYEIVCKIDDLEEDDRK